MMLFQTSAITIELITFDERQWGKTRLLAILRLTEEEGVESATLTLLIFLR